MKCFSKSVLEEGEVSAGVLSQAEWTCEAHWITPAAWGALMPSRTVHARTSCGPHVK